MVCAVIWSLWKHRNDLCFNNTRVYTAKNLILQTLSLVSYWTGNAKEEIKATVQDWISQNIDAIPLQVVDPDDMLMLEWVTNTEDKA